MHNIWVESAINIAQIGAAITAEKKCNNNGSVLTVNLCALTPL
jgi:hypothetical protein